MHEHDKVDRAEITVHHHVHLHIDDRAADLIFDIRNLKEKVTQIMTTQAEQAQILRDVLAQQQKTAAEIGGVQTEVTALKARIAELEAAAGNQDNASQELVDAVAAVKAQAQVVDDAIPDAPTPAPTPEG